MIVQQYQQIDKNYNNFIELIKFLLNDYFIILTFDNDTIKLWKMAIGECRYIYKSFSDFIVFLLGSTFLASAFKTTIKLWDIIIG